jgi:NAD(P)-dependent dehydrogenase (short-subunit alcohol dehydrogenase family)
MKNKRIALITGANKGIGFEVARQLSKDYGMTVLLGARDEQRGKEAEVKLQGEGSDLKFLHLDLNDETTHETAHQFIEDTFGKLDIIINNAGIGRRGHMLLFTMMKGPTARERQAYVGQRHTRQSRFV